MRLRNCFLQKTSESYSNKRLAELMRSVQVSSDTPHRRCTKADWRIVIGRNFPNSKQTQYQAVEWNVEKWNQSRTNQRHCPWTRNLLYSLLSSQTQWIKTTSTWFETCPRTVKERKNETKKRQRYLLLNRSTTMKQSETDDISVPSSYSLEWRKYSRNMQYFIISIFHQKETD